jgi:inner membrane protein
MDPVTHGLVGATFSQSFAGKKSFRAASLTGFASALLADADIFISSSTDPLLNLEIHRQFTHSLLFIPVGALIATCLVWWFTKKHLTLKETYLFSFAGYATAGFMDYLTSYGVHLLWPFSGDRYSLDIISVFDPVFTIGILILTGLAFFKRQKIYSGIALAWIFSYLIFGFSQQQKAYQAIDQIIIDAGHAAKQTVVKPTIANQLLWSARYISADTVYSHGFRLIPFNEPQIYKGQTAPLLDWQSEYSELEGTTLYRDIRRFSDLSNGYLISHPDHKNVIGDARYSMLPTTLSPLWGISADTSRPNKHVSFDTYRDADPEVRKAFIDMLMGSKPK